LFGETPLHLAAKNGNLGVIEFLISQNADIHSQSNGFPSGTPLHLAASNGKLNVVEYLISHEVDINILNDIIGRTLFNKLLFI